MVIVQSIPYRNLPNDKVKEMVVVTFRHWLNEVYKIILKNQVIHEMFEMLNNNIEFFIDDDGKRKFRIDDSDERLAKFLGDQFAIAAKLDKNIYDKILMNMIRRNEGDDRLKVK